jgi:glycosyltransferase involved in cell wall biosynthesis
MSGPARWLHVFATLGAGGPQVRAMQLLRHLGPGIEHVLVAMDGCTDVLAQAPAGATVRVLPAPARGGVLANVKALQTLLAAERPNLVLTYNWGAIEAAWAARRLRLPLVHHEDGFLPDEAQRRHARRSWLRWWVLKGTPVVVPSAVLQRIAVGEWGLRAREVHHLVNGVDLARFVPRAAGGLAAANGPGAAAAAGSPAKSATASAAARPAASSAAARPAASSPAASPAAASPAAARPAAARPLVVGTVGGLRPEKDHATLLAAFAQCPDTTRLQIVGGGPLDAPLRSQAHALGIADRVQFVGPVADTAPCYAQFDVFVLSSRTEQLPLVLLEAMACGLPVVATDVGDVRATLPYDAGPCIAPPADADALASSLRLLLGNQGLRARLGQKNRQVVAERFAAGACLQRFVDLYRQTAR